MEPSAAAFVPHWTFRPLLLLGLLGLGWAYGLLWRKLQQRGASGLSRLQPWAFGLGLAGAALLSASPFDDLGQRALFSARMFEYILLVYVMPGLLWLGIPAAMAEKAWRHTRHLPQWLGSLVVPSLAFNLFFMLLHVPAVYELGLRNQVFNELQLLALLAGGLMMWMPMLCAFGPLRLSLPRQMFYVVTLVFAQVPVFALLTFSRQVLYASYLEAPRVAPLSAYADQQLGGWMLKTVSSVIFAAAFIRIFLEWNSHARLQDEVENVTAFENIELVRRATERKG